MSDPHDPLFSLPGGVITTWWCLCYLTMSTLGSDRQCYVSPLLQTCGKPWMITTDVRKIRFAFISYVTIFMSWNRALFLSQLVSTPSLPSWTSWMSITFLDGDIFSRPVDISLSLEDDKIVRFLDGLNSEYDVFRGPIVNMDATQETHIKVLSQKQRRLGYGKRGA